LTFDFSNSHQFIDINKYLKFDVTSRKKDIMNDNVQ
jgi:hypothetical protein